MPPSRPPPPCFRPPPRPPPPEYLHVTPKRLSLPTLLQHRKPCLEPPLSGLWIERTRIITSAAKGSSLRGRIRLGLDSRDLPRLAGGPRCGLWLLCGREGVDLNVAEVIAPDHTRFEMEPSGGRLRLSLAQTQVKSFKLALQVPDLGLCWKSVCGMVLHVQQLCAGACSVYPRLGLSCFATSLEKRWQRGVGTSMAEQPHGAHGCF